MPASRLRSATSATRSTTRLMESTIGLYKTEVIEHDRDRSWSGAAEVERETTSWVRWFNTSRIHHSIGKMSPIEFEALHRERSSITADEEPAV